MRGDTPRAPPLRALTSLLVRVCRIPTQTASNWPRPPRPFACRVSLLLLLEQSAVSAVSAVLMLVWATSIGYGPRLWTTWKHRREAGARADREANGEAGRRTV